MKKKGWIILLIVLIVLFIGAGISLTVSCVYGTFDLMVIDTMMSKPKVALTHEDGNPQLELSHTFLKIADQEKYEVGILVFDSSTDDFKSGKQKLKYDEIIKNDNLLYASEPAELKGLKDCKVSYVLNDEFCCREIDAYTFLVKDKILHLSRKITTSVDKEASKKLAKMKKTDADYGVYEEFSLYYIARCNLIPSVWKQEDGKYTLHLEFLLSKSIDDLCKEFGFIIFSNNSMRQFSPGVYTQYESIINEENKGFVKYVEDSPIIVNKKGIEDDKGDYLKCVLNVKNFGEDKVSLHYDYIAYAVYNDKVIFTNVFNKSVNEVKELTNVE